MYMDFLQMLNAFDSASLFAEYRHICYISSAKFYHMDTIAHEHLKCFNIAGTADM